jgi:hypothetical protein
MIRKSALVLVALAGVCLIAARGSLAAADRPPAAATTAPKAGAPAVPAGVTKLQLTTSQAAYPKADAPDWHAPDTVAFRDDVSFISSVIVVISTYPVSSMTKAEFAKRAPPEKGKGRIELFLTLMTRGGSGEKAVFVPGTYDASKDQAEKTALLRIAVAGGASVTFAQPQGAVEVTALTATSISGKFDVRDNSTHLVGEFTAPLK